MPQAAHPMLDRSNIEFVTPWEPQPHLWSPSAVRSTVYLLVYIESPRRRIEGESPDGSKYVESQLPRRMELPLQKG